MPNSLMISISGIRGVVGETLLPQDVLRFSLAFARVVGMGRIVIGRDNRASGEWISRLVTAALLSAGNDVVDIGIAPTPTVEIVTKKLGATGGVIITASHNSAEWNALKFVGKNGIFLNESELGQLLSFAASSSFQYAGFDETGTLEKREDGVDMHIENILSLPYLELDAIRRRRFRVVYDPNGGAGVMLIPKLLKKLGCEVILVNDRITGFFYHPPEPLPQNLVGVSDAVRVSDADIGFATDPDADRLAVIDEAGKPIGEELTLPLCARYILSKKRGAYVVNVSSSLVNRLVAEEFDVPFYQTKVGELNVTDKMVECSAVIGGEGNGGVILPDSHLGRDAGVGIALILALLAERNCPISEQVNKLPEFHTVKLKLPMIENLPSAVENVIQTLLPDNINKMDGWKLEFQDRWVQIRASNTEPIVRIYAEAPTNEEAKQMANRVREILREGMEI
ncbi:phosphoglucosamine mutase [bacterium]|nr:phosphoglucosamine mutase [bacterium]